MKKFYFLNVIFFLLLVFNGFSQDINVVWEKTFGKSEAEEGYCVKELKYGGYIIVGWTGSFGHGGEVYLIKLDKNGDIIWEKNYEGRGAEQGRSIIEDRDGNFIIVGRSSGQAYILKVDKEGNKVWEKYWGGGDDSLNCVININEKENIACGYTKSFGNGGSDSYILKFDENGEKIWEKTYGGKGDEETSFIIKAKDGGFIAVGFTTSETSGCDIYILKIDEEGEVIWEKTFGGSGDDNAYSICESFDGGYIIVGETTSFTGDINNVYILKIDENGEKICEKNFGFSVDEEGNIYIGDRSAAYSIKQTLDKKYIITGYRSGNVYVLKLDKNLELIWEGSFGGERDEYGFCIEQISDGGYIIVGDKMGFDPNVYVIKIEEK